MSFLDDPGVYTPYSTVKALFSSEDESLLQWVPELDRDRILAYQKYEEIYWNHNTAFQLKDVTADNMPLYVPNPMTICDTTSHFYMKGMEITAKGKFKAAWDAFNDREMFLPKFHEGKHSGVVRGDFIFHITADEAKPEGTRVSINAVDPGAYFPEFDPDDLNRVIAVNLVEVLVDDQDPTKTEIRRQRYSYVLIGGKRRVQSMEAIYDTQDWIATKGQTQTTLRTVKAARYLPEEITQIPVYAYKNKPWQGQPFGCSEIKGHESLQARINQSATDEDVALSLEGLGVYATDAPPPTRTVDGQEVEQAWVIAPGMVVEVPTGSTFRRVEGLKSVEPFQDHLKFLTDSMYEATATFRPSVIDASVAESGIALAIKFLPTMAKLEERDLLGVGKTQQMLFDLKAWLNVYDGAAIPDTENAIITLGDKLPENKTDQLNTLNNMLDRKAISKQFYREQITELFGVEFPSDIEKQIEDEARAAFKLAQELAPPDPDGNQSNNRERPNESGGTEAK